MNVDELQLHLSNLAQLLENAGGKRVAGELGDLCQRLQPHRMRKLSELFAFIDAAEAILRSGRKLDGIVATLEKAEEIVRTGVPPAKPKKTGGKTKAGRQLVENVCNQIVDLYHKAKEPETTRDQIEAAFGELDRLNLTLAPLQALAKRLDISRKLKKPDAVATMMRAVLERKGAVQRVQV